MRERELNDCSSDDQRDECSTDFPMSHHDSFMLRELQRHDTYFAKRKVEDHGYLVARFATCRGSRAGIVCAGEDHEAGPGPAFTRGFVPADAFSKCSSLAGACCGRQG